MYLFLSILASAISLPGVSFWSHSLKVRGIKWSLRHAVWIDWILIHSWNAVTHEIVQRLLYMLIWNGRPFLGFSWETATWLLWRSLPIKWTWNWWFFLCFLLWSHIVLTSFSNYMLMDEYDIDIICRAFLASVRFSIRLSIVGS